MEQQFCCQLGTVQNCLETNGSLAASGEIVWHILLAVNPWYLCKRRCGISARDGVTSLFLQGTVWLARYRLQRMVWLACDRLQGTMWLGYDCLQGTVWLARTRLQGTVWLARTRLQGTVWLACDRLLICARLCWRYWC